MSQYLALCLVNVLVRNEHIWVLVLCPWNFGQVPSLLKSYFLIFKMEKLDQVWEGGEPKMGRTGREGLTKLPGLPACRPLPPLAE